MDNAKLEIKEEYFDVVNDIWKYTAQELLKDNSSKGEILNSGFEIRKYLKKKSILFIGINPAGKGEAGKDKNETEILDIYNFDIYDENGQKKGSGAKKDKIKGQNSSAEDFLAKHNEICDYCGVAMSHIDMLFANEHEQAELFKNIAGRVFKDFKKKQIELSSLWIAEVNPLAIVFCNRRAADLFLSNIKQHIAEGDPDYNPSKETELKKKKNIGDLAFNQEWGTYSLQLKFHYEYKFKCDENKKPVIRDVSLNDVPVFFARPLNGSGAIDNGSYYRLKWHIKHVLQLKGIIP